MRILYIIGKSGIGGHTRSALCYGCALKKLGHDIYFAYTYGKGANLVEQSGLRQIELPTNCVGKYSKKAFSIAKTLVNKNSIELIHAYDDDGLSLAYFVSHYASIPLVMTVCGGAVSKTNLLPFHTVLFSQELADGLAKQRQNHLCKFFINAARMEIENEERNSEAKKILERNGMNLSLPIIMMIKRIDSAYRESILYFVNAAERSSEISEPTQFVLVGKVGDKIVKDELDSKIQGINRKSGHSIVFHIEDSALTGKDFYDFADIVVGAGRSAFEAMLKGKPVMIVGNRGFAGLVSSDIIDELAYFNFSGRNVSCNSPEASFKKFLMTIQELFKDDQKRISISTFGRRWASDNLDIKKGANQIIKIYADALENYRLNFRSKKDIRWFYFSMYYRGWRYSFLPKILPISIRKIYRKLKCRG